MSQPQQPGLVGPHGQPAPTAPHPGQPAPDGQPTAQWGAGPGHGTQYAAPYSSGPHQPHYGSGPAAPAGPPHGGYPPQGSFPQHGTAPTPPQGKPKRPLLKRWWFWVLVVLAILIVGGIAGGGGDDASTDAADTSQAAEAAADDDEVETENAAVDAADEAPAEDSAAAYGLGEAVPTGDWEITVADVQTGVSEVGNEFLGATAQGQYVLVDIAVKNTGSSPSYFFEDDVKLQDGAGNTYATDSEASLYTTESGDMFLLEEINPGNTATGVLVFDVPTDVAPTVLTFQGGIFDTPAEVALD